ncbi:MAG: hypothetical protein JNG88_14360 [Phycisphaerales bacterium]|nr:hypothetical protein [Phycisphaerales bacterium]
MRVISIWPGFRLVRAPQPSRPPADATAVGRAPGRSLSQPTSLSAIDFGSIDLPREGFDVEKLQDLELHLLTQAMDRVKNNQTQAAKLLNLSRDRLRDRLQKHGML